MNRKVFKVALLLPLLCCLMGADAINWAAGSPVANPGGAPNTVNGSGNYAVCPINQFSGVYFWKGVGKLQTPTQAQAGNNNWQRTLTVAAGNYDFWGEIVTITPPFTVNSTITNKVNLNVK